MENITIKNEHSPIEKSIANIPHLHTIVNLTYNPSRTKSTSKPCPHNPATETQSASTSTKEIKRRNATTRRKQSRTTLKQRTAHNRHHHTQHENAQPTSDITRDFKHMHITLPPIATYIPSSTLTLAPFHPPTPTTPPTTAHSPLPPTKVSTSTTQKEKTAPLFALIGKAILSTPDRRMTTRQITRWIREKYPHRCTVESYVGQQLAKKGGLFGTVDRRGSCYIWSVVGGMEGGFV